MKLQLIRNILFGVALFSGVAVAAAGDEVTVVDRPATGTKANYPAFRAPLQQAPLLKLPVGAVQPSGWLRRYLELQRDGLNGKLGTISAWLDKNNNQWLGDGGDHGWEEVPYWLRGYSSLAYILDDEEMKREAQVWFDAVLDNIRDDGFLGPRNFEGDSPEIWAQMIMLWALQTYYEHSGDERVLKAMTDYFKWEMTVPDSKFLKGLWQEKRGGDNLWSLLWLYNRTGDKSVLSLADKLHRNTSDWTQRDVLPNWHGVNVAQGFREPATYYMYNGDEQMLRATYNDFDIMRKSFGQMPGGMYAADENARDGYHDPRQGTETCALVEQMASDEILMGITGDPFWADHCENVALNSFTASMMPDMRSLRYLTAANMAVSDEKLHGPSIDNNLRGMLSMSPFSSRCCQHNHGMGWPYYAEHLVMATTDGGLATMLYAANTTTARVADGKEVSVTETTNYPFDDTIGLTVTTRHAVRFPLYLRIPAWADGCSVAVNGKPVKVGDAAGRYVRIDRKWKNGDRVDLVLPMKVVPSVWPQNKSAVSLAYGPLSLSLKIDEICESHDSRDRNFVQDDSHWQQGVDASQWPCFVLRPGSDWNYALVVDSDNNPVEISMEKKPWPSDDFPFTPGSVPFEFKTKAVKIPSWGYDKTGMTDTLPGMGAAYLPQESTVSLIPMGAARLRVSAFPRADVGSRPSCAGNPVVEGWYADPEGVVFGDRYWIYPTLSLLHGTDSIKYRADLDRTIDAVNQDYRIQTHFDAFSSPDLVSWTRHPEVLTVDSVKWAKFALWAPSVVHANGKYYLFFGANDIQNNDQTGGIGVAVSDRPEGPFTDALGKPLVASIVNGAQPIDQFVYFDEASGEYYMFYGGWRHCNVVRLSSDLLSVVPFPDGELYKEVTPENYVEGPFMLKRDGKYYFMWSEGGWGGPDYCVAYAIADSPLGPFRRIGKILEQDPAVATGAGHHSVIRVPGKDEYYIVYHRHPLGHGGSERVVCIDRLEFAPDGTIRPVSMTFEGPVATAISR